MNRPLNDAWFAEIERYDPWFSRKDEKTVVLSFNGYNPSPTFEVERALMKHGGAVMSMNYDKVCGKTFVQVREPKAVVAERDVD